MNISAEEIKAIAALELPAREAQLLTILKLLSNGSQTLIYDNADLKELSGQSAQSISRVIKNLTQRKIILRTSRNKIDFNF